MSFIARGGPGFAEKKNFYYSLNFIEINISCKKVARWKKLQSCPFDKNCANMIYAKFAHYTLCAKQELDI